MVFTEEQLGLNPLSILDQAVYLEQGESACQAITIPVCENQRLNTYTIHVEDILRFSEQNGIDYSDAVTAIAESHNLQPSDITVVINEADIVVEPGLVYEFNNVVVAPISEHDHVYQVCEALTEDCLNNDTLDYLMEAVCNEIAFISNFAKDKAESMATAKYGDTIKDLDAKRHKMWKIYSGAWQQIYDRFYNWDTGQWGPQGKPRRLRHQGLTADDIKALRKRVDDRFKKSSIEWYDRTNAVKDKQDEYRNRIEKGLNYGLHGALLGGTAGAAYGVFKAVQAYRNKPKSVIAKKIASLRSIYSKWMKRAQSSRDSGIAAKLKRGAAKILQVIDKLMAFLQRKTDGK